MDLPFNFDPQALGQGVNQFFDNPQNRAMLLSTGLSLMQPPSFGDTPASQIARAIGAGGETVGRQEAMDQKQQEASSKQDLRSAQAIAAEARAGAAATRAGAAQERLTLEGERQRGLNERARLGARIRLSNLYQNYVRDTQRSNLVAPQPAPIQSFEDWVRGNPSLNALNLLTSEPAAAGGGGTGAPAPTSAAPAPGEVRDGFRFRGGDPSVQANWERV